MSDSPQDQLLGAFEVHSVDGIRAALAAGVDANAPIRGRGPIDWLLEMYTRSPRFSDCFAAMLDAGAAFEDELVKLVLLDDAAGLAAALGARPGAIDTRFTMNAAFTPLVDASLLHVAAEFVRVNAARVLIEHGAPLDARAAVDEHGLNGHTALFHTVNSNANYAQPIMRLLLDAGARVDVQVAGITWGRGYEWETTFFDVTPISYAQLGTLRQMHRDERQITENVKLLLTAAGRPVPPLPNVPNAYAARS